MKNITTVSSFQTVTLLKDHFNYLTFKCITISTFRLSQLCLSTYPQRRGLRRSRGQRFHIRGKLTARIIPFRYLSSDPSIKRIYGEWRSKIFQNLPHQILQKLSLKKGDQSTVSKFLKTIKINLQDNFIFLTDILLTLSLNFVHTCFGYLISGTDDLLTQLRTPMYLD